MVDKLPAHKKSAFLDKVKKAKSTAVAAQSSSKKALGAALNNKRVPLLLFAMDATASREPAWAAAQKITSKMFEQIPADLRVALAYHSGGELKEVTPYTDNAKQFADKVHQVRCQAGATALNAILSNAAQTRGLKALVYIGDCFEEDEQTAYDIAKQLKMTGTKCFFFHDTSCGSGWSVDGAREVFDNIVTITGGAVMDFNDQVIQESGDLLQAVAVFASVGKKALENKTLTLPGADKLLGRLK